MFRTTKLGVIAALTVVTIAVAACSNSVTDVAAGHRATQPTASHDSTGGGTCLTGWVVIDGITSCPGGH